MALQMRQLQQVDMSAWDAFVQQHPLGRAEITSSAAEQWRQIGWHLSFLGEFDDAGLVSGLAFCSRKFPLLPRIVLRVWAILPCPQDISGSASRLLKAMEEYASSKRGLEIDVRCRVVDKPLDGLDFAGGLRTGLLNSGFSEMGERQGTYLVAIESDDERLINSFSSKCRRDVRKGLREGVTEVELRSLEDLERFCKIHKAMWQRKAVGHESYLDYDMLAPVFQQGHFRLFVAMHNGQWCNLALIDALGIPQYRYGATTEAALAKGVPPTGQPLHFHIMRWARDHGAHYYDLGGSPGPEPVEGHPNFNVWRFKREFNGDYVWWIPHFRRPMSVLGRLATSAARHFGRLT